MCVLKNKIFVSIFIIISFVIISFNAFAYTTSNRVVFEEDFSMYSKNGRVAYHPGGKGINDSMTPLRGWKWSQAYNTTLENGVIADYEDGNSYAKIYTDGSENPISFVSSEFGENFTNYIISARIKVSENAVGGLGIVNSNANISMGYPLEKLIYFKNGIVYANNEESSENSYAPDEWYNIRFCINRAAYNYSVRIYNDAGFDISYSDELPDDARKNKMRFGCELEQNSMGSICIDDVLICKIGTQNPALAEDDSFSLTGDDLAVSVGNSLELTSKILLADIPESSDIAIIDSENNNLKIKSVVTDNTAKKITVKLSENLKPIENYKIIFNSGIRNAFGQNIKSVEFETAFSELEVKNPQIYIDGAESTILKTGTLSCTISLTPTQSDINPCIAMALYKNETLVSFAQGEGVPIAKGNQVSLTSANLTIPAEDISSSEVRIYLWDCNSKSPLSTYWVFDENGLDEGGY